MNLTASTATSGAKITAKAAGKLFLAGEYAVVTPGRSALVVAVDRYVTVEVTRLGAVDTPVSATNPHTAAIPVLGAKIIDPAYGDRVQLDIGPDGTATIGSHQPDALSAAITAVERLRVAQGQPPVHYELRVTSELRAEAGQKFGLGSSGAVIVATVTALGQLHQLALSDAERFQLALLAAVSLSPRGSGGDIAASVFGGLIRYQSPDRARLAADYAHCDIVTALNSAGWQNCVIEPVAVPPVLHLLAGWTGTPALTESLVANSQRARLSEQAAQAFEDASDTAVQQLVGALAELAETDTPDAGRGAVTDITAAVAAARANLLDFAAQTGVQIETAQLQSMTELALAAGAAAKTSGAGGGDCGIALAFDSHTAKAVTAAWQSAGFTELGLTITEGAGDAIAL